MELVDWIFFGPAKLIAAWPYAGFLVAAAMIGVQAALSWRKGALFERVFFREAAVFAGLLWVIFNLYELQFAATLAQKLTGSSLRMDLIILVPILYVLTLAAMLSIRTQLKTKSTNA